MQDHDFEKQVHQKMEEIKILPSEAVWKEVEKKLHPKNRSKRWIWLPFLLIAISIGGFLLNINNPASHQSLQPSADLSLNNTNAYDDLNNKTANRKEVSKTTKDKKQEIVETLPYKETYLLEKNKESAISGQWTLPAPVTHSFSRFKKTAKLKENSLSQNNSSKRYPTSHVTNKLPVDTLHLLQSESLSGISGNKNVDSSGNRIMIKEPVPTRVNLLIAPAFPINTALSLRNSGVAANVPVQKQQKRLGWEWGLSMRAGQSDVTNGKFTSLFTREAVADRFNSPTLGNQSLSPSAPYIPPSAVQPGPGLSAGLFITKQLTKRSSVSAGLQYARFTTSHKVGTQVTGSPVILQPNNSADQKSIEAYFRPGNTGNYTNKYHFIEMPVSFQTQIISNRLWPVYWNIGFSFSRLVSSNALHYDGNSRIYYQNNSILNRNQFSFISGLPVRILSKERFSLKAGPLFQYGISNLINKSESGSRHLLFMGVKADITLFK